MFFITHVAACIWYVVGQSAMYSYPPLPDGTPCSWILRYIPDHVIIPSERYAYSLHFALTTMTTVGYGDISPTNVSELIVTQILLVVSAVIFAGTLTIINTSIAGLYEAAQVKRAACQKLTKYMNWRAIPRPLQSTV